MDNSVIVIRAGAWSYLVRHTHFSAGEIHLNLKFDEDVKKYDRVVVEANIKDAEGIMLLALAADIVYRAFPDARRVLLLKYLPYSRQDRVCSPGDAYSLRVFAGIINTMRFTSVVTLDVHSKVAYNHFINLTSIPMAELIVDKFPEFRYRLNALAKEGAIFMAPDKGAMEKVTDTAFYLKSGMVVMYATKVRDPGNGQILATSLPEFDGEGKTVVICDDICDGGRTFIELAKLLKEDFKVAKVILYVTHGIFSKGFDELKQWIDEFYVYNWIGKGVSDQTRSVNLIIKTGDENV